jgi:hypothetical protein
MTNSEGSDGVRSPSFGIKFKVGFSEKVSTFWRNIFIFWFAVAAIPTILFLLAWGTQALFNKPNMPAFVEFAKAFVIWMWVGIAATIVCSAAQCVGSKGGDDVSMT